MGKQQILIMHQGAIGDLILSLPSLYSLRKKYPEAHFEAMGYPYTLSLIYKRFYADAIVFVDRAGMSALYNDDGCLNEELLRYLCQFKKAFIFGGKTQEVVIKNIQQIKGGPEVYSIKPFPDSTDMHVTDFQLSQLGILGFDNQHIVPKVYLRTEDISQAQQLLHQQQVDMKNSPLVAVHTGSGSRAKNWPLENYSYLVRMLYKKYGGTVLVVEGPAEKNTKAALIEALDSIAYITLQCLALPLLAAVLSQCDLFIGNDSGITHLAAALGVPTIALFGPTEPRVWEPRGTKVYIARGDLDDGSGWKWASTDAVLKAALDFLNKS